MSNLQLENGVKVCAFTGHRDFEYFVNCVDSSLLLRLEEEIRAALDRGVREFLCGMAQGFDLCAAETLLRIAENYKGVRLIAVIPCADQTDTFSQKNRERHEKIIKSCFDTVVLSDKYTKGCMHIRDRYLVDHCDEIICFLRKKSGGTFYTVRYARKSGKKVIEI